jgi:hypothetical protein
MKNLNETEKIDPNAGIFPRLWNGWKRIARRIGDFNARLILTVFYFVLLAPFSLIVCMLDPMGLRRKSNRAWTPRHESSPNLLEHARRQS